MKNVEGHYYLDFHPGWGSCVEELFHYTSRYYLYTEAFLRNLSENRDFSMSGYKADILSDDQRELMAAVLCYEPVRHTGRVITSIVSSALQGVPHVAPEMIEPFRQQMDMMPGAAHIKFRTKDNRVDKDDVSPIDPFLNIAKRLQLPVAIVDHHVEVSLHELAEHLDSTNSRIRTNLQDAVLRLHNAGYLLKNHQSLTHTEAFSIADEGAV